MVAVASLLVLLRWCLLSGAAPKAVVSADRLLEADLSIIVSLLRLVGLHMHSKEEQKVQQYGETRQASTPSLYCFLHDYELERCLNTVICSLGRRLQLVACVQMPLQA